ncbi:MAG: transaldolase [Candidatus Obscuribacterales bacterium]|nr:transaldolase [Candidatus Obscuribacterales bacterium]
MANGKTKFFADGAKKETMLEMYSRSDIAGLTTNPTLMVKAGIANYKEFAVDILKTIKDKPISFEVFSDDFEEMEEQALEIASWGDNVYVKIPISNTQGKSAAPLIKRLTSNNVKVNVTAITLVDQVEEVLANLKAGVPAYVSVFAGRIADCGVDPLPVMKKTMELLAAHPHVELIWASPREVLNVAQAQSIGCHIITLTDDIFKKIPILGKDLAEMSLDTVKMFYKDAVSVGYTIETKSVKKS